MDNEMEMRIKQREENGRWSWGWLTLIYAPEIDKIAWTQ